MRASSTEFRGEVLAACDAQEGTRAIALRFNVSESWVRRIQQQRRETGQTLAEKKTLIAAEQDRPDVVEKRQQWSAPQAQIDPDSSQNDGLDDEYDKCLLKFDKLLLHCNQSARFRRPLRRENPVRVSCLLYEIPEKACHP
jgi:hypothetical protein